MGHGNRLPLYSIPRPCYEWTDEDRKEKQTTTGDLFYDLVFVGVIFNSGHFLADEISWRNFWVFFATIICMYSAWRSRLHECSLIEADDYFHKVLHAAQGLSVALAANSIVSLDLFEDYVSGAVLTFSSCILVTTLLHSVIWIELFFLCKTSTAAKPVATFILTTNTLPKVLLLIASIVMFHYEIDVGYIAITWFCCYYIPQTIFFMKMLKKANPKKFYPTDILYVNARLSQYNMIILGEGVLQLVIFDFSPNSTSSRLLAESTNQIPINEYVAQVVFGYILMATLMLLHYSSMPFHINDHPFRKSRIAGVIWFETLTTYFIAIICVGVGIKLLLKLDGIYYSKYYWFFLISLACCLLLRFALQVLNTQWSRHERDMSFRHVTFQILFPFLCLAFAPLKVHPWLLLLLMCCLLQCLFAWQIAHGRFKRKRKLNRVLIMILVIGKLKRRIRRYRELKLEASSPMPDDKITPPDTEEAISLLERQVDSSEIKTPVTNEAIYLVRSEVENKVKSSCWSSCLRRRKTFLRLVFENSNLYSSPGMKQDWITVHEIDHSNSEIEWADLFFDLTYVGVSVRINDITNYTVEGFFIQLVIFLVMYDLWFSRVLSQSRFAAADVLHKLVDVCRGCAVAVMASSIHPTWTNPIPNYNPLYIFATGHVIVILLDISLYWEVSSSCKIQSKQAIAGLVLGGLLPGVCAFLAIAYQLPVAAICSFWCVGLIAQHLFNFLLFSFKIVLSKDLVPVDLHHVLHRISEIGLIFIGEGLLSLISVVYIGSTTYFVSFILCFVLLALVRQLFFFVERLHDPSNTAARHSLGRAILQSMASPLYMFGFCLIGGTGLTSFIDGSNVDDPEFHLESYSFTLLGFLFLSDQIHQHNEFTRWSTWPSWSKFLLIVILVCKMYTIGQFVIIGQFTFWAPSSILTAQIFTLLLMILTQRIHNSFRESIQAFKICEEPGTAAVEGEDPDIEMELVAV